MFKCVPTTWTKSIIGYICQQEHFVSTLWHLLYFLPFAGKIYRYFLEPKNLQYTTCASTESYGNCLKKVKQTHLIIHSGSTNTKHPRRRCSNIKKIPIWIVECCWLLLFVKECFIISLVNHIIKMKQLMNKRDSNSKCRFGPLMWCEATEVSQHVEMHFLLFVSSDIQSIGLLNFVIPVYTTTSWWRGRGMHALWSNVCRHLQFLHLSLQVNYKVTTPEYHSMKMTHLFVQKMARFETS
jgi:hypothetical protein